MQETVVTVDNKSDSRSNSKSNNNILRDNLEDYIVETLSEFIKANDVLPVFNKYKDQIPLSATVLAIAMEDMQLNINNTLGKITNIEIKAKVEKQACVYLSDYINRLRGIFPIDINSLPNRLPRGKRYKQ